MVTVTITKRPLGNETKTALRATTEADVQRYIAEDGSFDMGDVDPAKVIVRRPDPDPRAVRERLGMSRDDFAGAFGLPLSTIVDWETHKVEPDAPARALLQVIAFSPETVRAAVASTSGS